MAFFSVLLMNTMVTILLCVACGLLIAGIVLLIVGFKISKSGKKKTGNICKIIGSISLVVVAAFALYCFWYDIFPKQAQLQTPSGVTVSVRENDCVLLRRAINYENTADLKQLITDDPNLLYYVFSDDETSNGSGRTLIGYAISERLDDSAIALLELGVEPDDISTEETDEGAISLFIQNCNNTYASDWELEMISTFLDYGDK